MRGRLQSEAFSNVSPSARPSSSLLPARQIDDEIVSEAEEDELTFKRLREMGYL
jgi:hypothetical protein